MLGFLAAGKAGGRMRMRGSGLSRRLQPSSAFPASQVSVHPTRSSIQAIQRWHRSRLGTPHPSAVSKAPRLAHPSMAASIVCVARPAGRQAAAPAQPSHTPRPSVQARALSMPVPQPTFGASSSFTAPAAAAAALEAGPSCPWPQPAPQRRGIFAWAQQVSTGEGRTGCSAGCSSGAAPDSVQPLPHPLLSQNLGWCRHSHTAGDCLCWAREPPLHSDPMLTALGSLACGPPRRTTTRRRRPCRPRLSA